MSAIMTTESWAEELFSQCDLGDRRRTSRLVKVASLLANKIGRSLAAVCDGDLAEVEGAYRFIRNPSFDGQDIAEGGFQATAQKAREHKLLLAIEDTTSFNYNHQAEGLEEQGENNGNVRGFYAHSVLLVDPIQEKTVGLIEQTRWQRKVSEKGKRYQLETRAYEEKESFKWENASVEMAERLGEKMSDVISVCDREADVYDYLHFKGQERQRYIVRAVQNRKLDIGDELISDALNESPVMGHYTVEIEQKSGRKARKAEMELRSCTVTLKGVKRGEIELEELEVNVVAAIEVGDTSEGNERLSWVLLTTQAIDSFEEVRTIVRYYEMRWRIEEYHKAWKTGAGSERQRMQHADNLEKMIVILGFVAVRLLQLREAFEVKSTPENKLAERKCTEVLTQEEFIVLWLATDGKKNKKKSVPKEAHSLVWAYNAIAKLGGWTNSKGTGKASWLTIWDGWYRLSERLEGYRAAKIMAKM